MFTRFLTSEEPHARCYILQDGYLIYKAVTNAARYGYLDLYSSSARQNAEARWSHISLAAIRPLSDIVFAVDHNLVVAIRSGRSGHAIEASFLEFTTGSCHPLALVHTVSLPVHPIFDCRKPEIEVLGDHILVTAVHEILAYSTFSVISWKTGRVTQLYHLLGTLRVVVIDPDNSLIALIQCATNTIEICRLRFVFQQPCLHSLCFLRLPIFEYTNPTSVFTSGVEWIPTSKPQERTESQTSRRRPFPFRPYRASTIGLVLGFRTRDKGVCQCAMFISVGPLLSAVQSAVQSGVRHVPWVDWGPAGTRILPLGNGILPRPAGPFWITGYAPLVVRDYDSLRVRYIKKRTKKTSLIPSKPSLGPGPPSTKLLGEHWIEGQVTTHLPFRKIVAGDISLKRVVQVVADREWIIVISRTRRKRRTSITVYHVG
ncbi:hypothetical protein H4582DRAFT_821619 [Lactarius indigo]|nr:hypothetical protein H4582DRAFT_821619 [Lactarius indigo]